MEMSHDFQKSFVFVKARRYSICGFLGEQIIQLPPINIILIILQPFSTITNTNFSKNHHNFFG